jgi:branched-chain amino acid transport system ATP-binding protein
MLEVNHIDVCYGDIQALWDVSLFIRHGEIVTLVGSNGAGKSTIMKAVTGLVKLRRGTIVFEGRVLDRTPAHKTVDFGISMVPEGRRLFPEMTVLENLEVGASVQAARKSRETSLRWIYDTFPVLQKRSAQQAGTLSGGEQQMLAIGRALMAQPKLLLIDEMSLGLSPLVVQEICAVLQAVNHSRQLTICLVEQDVHLALSVANRGYIIENGRIVQEGDAGSLLSNTRIMEAYLGIKIEEEVG